MLYSHQTSWLIRLFFPHQLIWDFKNKYQDDKIIYLTFDDGPIPSVTEFVLDELAKYQARATFFCVGDNLRKYPAIGQAILKNHHAIGNHTYHHLNGWKTAVDDYIIDVAKCQKIIEDTCSLSTTLFRPPYGLLKPSQTRKLLSAYHIIMWDVLSGDFDLKLSSKRCYQKTITYTRPGSIVVFHDNIKATSRLYYTLPRFLKYFHELGYVFEKIDI